MTATPIDSKSPSLLPIAALVALAVLLPFDLPLLRAPLPARLGGDLTVTLVELAAAAVILAGCARWLLRRTGPEESRRAPFFGAALTWTALAWVATVFLSAVWAVGDQGRSDSTRFAARLALQVGVFLAAGSILGSSRNTPRRALADGLAFGASIGAMLVLCDLLWPDWATDGGVRSRWAGTFATANTAALYFEIVLLVAVAGAASAAEQRRLDPDRAGRVRWLRNRWAVFDLRLVGVGILALGVFATGSRGAALAVAVLLVGLIWVSGRVATLRSLRIPAGSAAAVLGAALSLSALGGNGLAESAASPSPASRPAVGALSAWSERPLLGIGPGQLDPDSIPLQLLAEMGLLGAAVAAVFAMLCLRRMRGGLRHCLTAEAGSRRALWLVGGFGAFALAALHGCFEGALGHHGVGLALGMSLALALSAAGDEGQQAGHPQAGPLP